VVGPFAASTISRQLTRDAFSSVIWCSMAAGTRMSHGVSTISLRPTGSPAG
jgi:hypothetical protein